MPNKQKLRFKPNNRGGDKAMARQMDFGELRDWAPNSSALLALVFGMINFGTASGIIMGKIADKVYSGYLILGLYSLILMSVPMAAVFSVSAIFNYKKAYRTERRVQDLAWLITSVICLLSTLLVLVKVIELTSGIY